jgi:hypothetical protein
MTDQDIQDVLDKIVNDLQTTQKGKTVDIAIRDETGAMGINPLSSDAGGVVNAAQLANIQQTVDALKPIADGYNTAFAPVKVAGQDFKTAQEPHEALITAARDARVALNTALEADQDYQDAKTALDAARLDPDYIAAFDQYKQFNVSENFGNLSDARGKYYG